MDRKDSRKKFLDVERGSIDKGSSPERSRRHFPRHIPTILPVRKLGHINFSDHYSTGSVGTTKFGSAEKYGSAEKCPEKEEWSTERGVCFSPVKGQITWLRNNASYAFFLLFFITANSTLFGTRLWQYRHTNVFEMLARGFGQCLNLNCAMLLTLILRRCVTRLRNSPLGALVPCDRHVHLHKMAGWMVFFCSVLHTVFHLSNFAGLSEVTGVSFWSYMLNPKHGIGWAWGLANPTGLGLMFMLFIIVTFSHRCIRKSGYFEVFYFTHLLSLPFWVLLILHGSSFWVWLLIPGTAFLTEACLRIAQVYSARGRTVVVAVERLPSEVMKLIIQRPRDFEFRAGEYLYINIPSVAKHEWHPFTISSAPEQEDTFSIHVRAVGGWTGRMFELFCDAPLQKLNPVILEPHGLLQSNSDAKKSFSSGSLNQDCSSIMEGKLDSGDFGHLSSSGKSNSFETLTSRYHANLIEFNRKISTVNVQPAVLVLENEMTVQKSIVGKRERKRSSSLSSLTFSGAGSDMGQWTPRHLDSGNTSLTGSCSSLQNFGTQAAFLQRFGVHNVSNSSPNISEKSYQRYAVGPAVPIQPIEVFVDGPYGSPSSSIYKVNHAVLVGAGIGVTPFASILQSVMYKYREAKLPCPHCQVASCVMMPATLKKLRKVDFIWVNRDVSHFEWFLELLAGLEGEQRLAGGAMERFLRLQLHNTGTAPLQPTLPLASAIRQGRPDWDKVFSTIRSEHSSKSKVSVFYCGPPALAHILRDMCLKYRLEFRREMF